MAMITVSSKEQLYDALSTATGGDTILLAEGNYGVVKLGTGVGSVDTRYDSAVTIKSADPDAPAVIEQMHMRGASNLTFDSVTFDYEFTAGDVLWRRQVNIENSDNITVRNSTIDGDVASGVSNFADGYGYGIGLSVRDSADVTIENNEVSGFHRGLVFQESHDVKMIANDVHSMRSDGVNALGMDGITLEDNYFHDFIASPASDDHRDFIQFWTTNMDVPNKDVIIRGNHLDIGQGSDTQSIFMRNEEVDRGQAGDEMFYQNVLIENNTIYNGHLHGITVGETDGLIIRNNSVLHADGDRPDGRDSGVEIPRINIAADSRNVTVEDNITSSIHGHNGQSGWQVANNLFLQDQDPDAPGYYADYFVDASLVMTDGVNYFIAKPDGMIEQLNVGSQEVRSGAETDAHPPEPETTRTNSEPEADIVPETDTADEAPETSEPASDQAPELFDITQDADNAKTQIFDASTLEASSLVSTNFVWDFGDGTQGNGVEVSHTYANGGTYTATLTAVHEDGMVITKQMPVTVEDASPLLSLSTTSGFTTYDDGQSVAIDDASVTSNGGIVIQRQGLSTKVDRDHVQDMLETDNLSIDFTMTSSTANATGEVFRLHESFTAMVTGDGEFFMRVLTEDGSAIRLTTQGAEMTSGTPKDVSFKMQDGQISISVDGAVLAQADMEGTLGEAGNHDLYFGNIWGAKNFEGVISDFEITLDNDPATGGTSAPETPIVEIVPEDDVADVPVTEPTQDAPTQPDVVFDAEETTDILEDVLSEFDVEQFIEMFDAGQFSQSDLEAHRDLLVNAIDRLESTLDQIPDSTIDI